MTTRSGVDTEHLRGRLVERGQLGPVVKDGGRQFGGITTQFFDVVPARARSDG